MQPGSPRRLAFLGAYATVYVVWGSTYLAIRYGIESLPPFLLAGLRFLLAGGLLYAWTAARGAPAPTRRQWLHATVVGGLMLLGGNGLVCWAEATVPSGIAALLVATVPVFTALFMWTRPSIATGVGIVLGFAGVAVLIGPKTFGGSERIHLPGAAALVLASASWAAGSLFARKSDRPASGLQAAAMQMLAGGALLMVSFVGSGQAADFDPSAVTANSAAALVYLIFFGSILGFTAYTWLLQATSPERAVTYAYVNPVVAVLLGWLFAGEPLSGRLAAAAIIITTAVVLIVSRPR